MASEAFVGLTLPQESYGTYGNPNYKASGGTWLVLPLFLIAVIVILGPALFGKVKGEDDDDDEHNY